MTYATVRSAAEHIARTGKITPQQLAALSGLDECLTAAQKQAFTELWRAEGSPAAAHAPEPNWLAPALAIISEFEGCRLEAYRCPAGVWTIGWGSTRIDGRPVKAGHQIDQTAADELLQGEVEHVARELLTLLPPAATWPGHRVAALISWAYNVGLGAVKDSTLRRRINAGESAQVVIPQELPKWDKANGAPLPSLTRRRAAEVALFIGAAIPPPPPPRFTPSSPLSTLVTSHISYGELCLGEQRRRFVNQGQCNIATELCAFIEKARAEFGNQPVIITSAHRPKAVNDAVGGAADSEHLYKPGCGAIDWYIKNVSVKLVQDWCDRNWPFSLGYGAPKGFVHLGIRAGSPRPRVRWNY